MHSEHKNNVLLTELVIVVLFFALISVIVVQMLVAAHRRSGDSARTQQALLLAQDWVERLSGREDPAEWLLSAGFVAVEADTYTLSASKDGLLIEARLQPDVTSAAGRLFEGQVVVYDARGPREDEQVPFVTLPMVYYIPTE